MAAEMRPQTITPFQVCNELDRLFSEKNLEMKVEPHWFDPTTQYTTTPDAFVYRLNHGTNEIGVVSMDHINETEIVEDNSQLTIHVRDIDVLETYRGQGIGRAILLYGLCHEISEHPELSYSFLEDVTPFSQDNERNLYYEFGYRFKPGDLQEKILNIHEFISEHMLNIYTKVVGTLLKKKGNRTENRKPRRSTRSKSKTNRK